MDDEQQPKRGGAGRFLWPFVLLAIVVLWWYFRPEGDPGATLAEQRADAALAATDPDDILVDLQDDVTPQAIAAIERDLGIRLALVDDTAAQTKLYRAHVDPAHRDAILAALGKRPEVEIAEPDAQVMLSPEDAAEMAVRAPELEPAHEGYPNDPKYKFQWHLRQIGMPEAWKLADGNGVIVAVLDTGVAYENYKNFHQLPDLLGITFVDPYDFVANTTHANDDHGHGSHVTGTIAQVTHNGVGVAGIARNVRIMPLKVLSGSGSGSVAGIADAIRYAADHGAKVINMSLGGAFPSSVLKKAVAYAHKKGVTVVCAAGNDGRGKVGYPAAYPGAIAVSATQFDEATTFYSNFGKDIDIAAPGGNTRVDQNGDGMPDGVLQNTIAIGDPTKDDYFGYMGTSMASPHVAGVAALVVGEGVTSPDRVEQILKDTARKPDKQNYTTDKYGAGIIDAPAAVLKARAQTGGAQFGLGLLMAGAVAASLRRRGRLGVKLGPSYLAGVLFGASGLFFLPYIAPGLSSLPVVHALTHGLPSWDLSVLGPAGHGNLVFFSALVPLVLLAVGYGVPRARAPLAGLAIGVTAHLAFFAVVPLTTMHVPALLGTAGLWLAGNALACLGLAGLALRR
ncbi:MAG TPA: S8 family serine peptidase [Kofleriaceae bacterium]|jgi:serine protease|nr:S8 family serine peptidase [Kofleriaceae bacterium]